MEKSAMIRIADTVFVGASSQTIQCGFCNMIHWSRQGDFEEDELKNLMRDSKAYPESYQEHEEFIRWGVLFNKTFIPCCGCVRMASTLKVLWDQRVSIIRFFKAIAEQNSNSSYEDSKLLKDV